MEIKHFRLIKTIAEEGNISSSSTRLFLTKSALSHQLRELEEQLGFKVFHRTRNRWRLTEEGEALHELATEVLTRIENSFQHIQRIQEGAKGTIRISTECYSFYQGLPSFIQKMAVLYPDIYVNLILDATHQPITKLLANEIDMAIVTSRPTSDQLSSIPLFEDEIFAILHQENPLNKQDFIEASDFSDVHLIIHSFPLETVSVYQQFLQPNQVHPVQISAIPLTEVSLEMVKTNMGVMCMPKWALAPFLLPPELVFKRLGQAGLKRTHHLVYRTVDHSKKYIRDFALSFQEEFDEK